jgi:hypothetical protein
MLIDPAQPAHPDLLSELVQHAHPGPRSAQPAETTPRGLFGQLGDDQIERMRRRQQRQQMHAPQLGRTEGATAPAGELAGAQIVDERVGHIGRDQVEQANGPGGRKPGSHARTLPEPPRSTSPPVLAKPSSRKLLTKTFGTPSVTEIRREFGEIWSKRPIILHESGGLLQQSANSARFHLTR